MGRRQTADLGHQGPRQILSSDLALGDARPGTLEFGTLYALAEKAELDDEVAHITTPDEEEALDVDVEEDDD